MHSKYADHSNVSHNISSIIQHGVGVLGSFSLGWGVITCRQSRTAGKIHHEKVIVRQFAWANNRLLAGDNLALHTTNTDNGLEMKQKVEQKISHRMAKVHDFLEMWQGSKNLRATQMESRAQNKQMTATGYISDTEEIIKASWWNIQHDAVAEFKLSERSRVPPALSGMDLHGGRTQVLTVPRI